MRLLRISCSDCEHYQLCPSKTRLYVNYCGSRPERIKHDIKAAEADCRLRRGPLLHAHIDLTLAVGNRH